MALLEKPKTGNKSGDKSWKVFKSENFTESLKNSKFPKVKLKKQNLNNEKFTVNLSSFVIEGMKSSEEETKWKVGEKISIKEELIPDCDIMDFDKVEKVKRENDAWIDIKEEPTDKYKSEEFKTEVNEEKEEKFEWEEMKEELSDSYEWKETEGQDIDSHIYVKEGLVDESDNEIADFTGSKSEGRKEQQLEMRKKTSSKEIFEVSNENKLLPTSTLPSCKLKNLVTSSVQKSFNFTNSTSCSVNEERSNCLVRKEHYNIPIRMNTKEKPFQCSLCSYRAARKGTLKDHMRTHTGEKPYKCSVCSYSAAQNGRLMNHMRTHTGEKPFECSVCSYSTTQNGRLMNHMRTHTGEKPFKCSVCSYSASQKGTLKDHMRTHTGEKPFKCTVCSYSAAQRGTLKDHMRTHTGEKPFQCSLCSYSSAHKKTLKEHIRIHSGE